LFIPFFILGIFVAVAFGSFTGKSNAVATLQLSTIVHDFVAGGDRGFRVFEAEAMTRDDQFKQEVRDATGDKNFDYSRFTISLTAISVGDGISDGVLTVSIKDDNLGLSEKYRQAFVDVFTREYKNADGLFRTRFVQKKQDEADIAEKLYLDSYAKLKQLPAAKNVPLDQLANWSRAGGLVDELGKQEAQVIAQQAQVQATIDTLGAASPAAAAASASLVLHQTVAPGDALAALNAANAALKASVTSIRQQRFSMSDGGLEPDFLRQLDEVRGLDNTRTQAVGNAENVRAVVGSAESTVDTTLSQSGGLAGSNRGRVAIVLAVTIIFGLIAIYAVEWLSQVRFNSPD
jgi:hypothetical protein